MLKKLTIEIPVPGNMAFVRRYKKFLLTSLCVLLFLPLLVYFCPGPIEGFWWSNTFGCSDHDRGFWHFQGGEVIEYREAPVSPMFVGTYRQISWNRVELNVLAGNNSTERFVLHPGLFYTHFGKHELNANAQARWWSAVTSHFYRVRNQSACRAIIAQKQEMAIRGKPE